MRKVFTLCCLFASLKSFSQNSSTSIQEALKSKMPVCGLVRTSPEPIADSITVTGNCWGKQKLKTDSTVNKVLDKGLTGKLTGLHVADTGTVPAGRRYGCNPRTKPSTDQPALVVDGKLTPIAELNTINTNDIESVEIIKPPVAAVIFGIDAVNGAIILTTKKTGYWKVYIKDKTDNKPIPGATVQIKNKQTRRADYLTTNDSGFILLHKKLVRDSVFSVSAVGYTFEYIPVKIGLNTLPSTILMERNIKICEEVIVRSYNYYSGCGRSRSDCMLLCKIAGINIYPSDSVAGNKPLPEPAKITAYPNPAARNANISIRIENKPANIASLRVVAASGTTLLWQKITDAGKQNTISFQTGNWPGGIYFIQLLYANGKTAASERIVIQ